MGEYANYALRGYIRGGLPHNPNYVPPKRPRCSCVECGKVCAGVEGLEEHRKMKHPTPEQHRRNVRNAARNKKISVNETPEEKQ